MGSAYDGNIRRTDLQTDTPYNTYTRGGLPPTPIAMPGKDALQAAAHPADGNADYIESVHLALLPKSALPVQFVEHLRAEILPAWHAQLYTQYVSPSVERPRLPTTKSTNGTVE